MYCKDCKWWVNSKEWAYDNNVCGNSEKIGEGLYTLFEDSPTPAGDMLGYTYYEGGEFIAGPMFGCVHFKDRG